MSGFVKIGDMVDRPIKEKTWSLYINDKVVGAKLQSAPAQVDTLLLSAEQTNTLIASLKRVTKIEFVGSPGSERWRLSDRGAVAVLRKMDDFQGRVGTKGALIATGAADESGVLPALPLPVIELKAIDKRLKPPTLSSSEMARLRTALFESVAKGEVCDEFGPTSEITLASLDATTLLAWTKCDGGAYNWSDQYWVLRARPPFALGSLVIESLAIAGNDYDDGKITAAFKGRGVGDCWSRSEYGWNGKSFVLLGELTTGMWRGVQAGGPWELPTFVSEAREKK